MRTTPYRSTGAAGFAGMIDHTLLKAGATRGDIKKLCGEAVRYGFYSVCVNPVNAALCRRALKGSKVKVCLVVGFPLGACGTAAKVFETKEAVKAGADEIDMVIDIGALKSGDTGLVLGEIKQIRSAARGKTLKVIIETAFLSKEEIRTACLLAVAGGADFVKTSTGFAAGGANVPDVRLMRRTVGKKTGVKASGGIKDAGAFLKLIKAGASRIGTSSSVKIIREIKGKNNER